MLHDVTNELLHYLKSWHRTSCDKKVAQGATVGLSFDQFMSLICTRQRKSLQKAIDEGRIRSQQHRDNPYALVLTWRSYSACSSREFNLATACVCSRMKSSQINKPQSGDKLRPDHSAKISRTLKGKSKTEEHRNSISEASRGIKKQGWSPERRAARSELRRAQEAAKRRVEGGVE